MIFNSLQYALFLPVVVIIYFSIPQRFRWAFLLAVSYYFYMCWNAKYALLMLFSTVITYAAALLMHKASGKRHKTFYLVSCLVINLGILVVFKYFNFFNVTIAEAMRLLGVDYEPLKLNLLLPVGISFYTFQALGYLIDVYKGKARPRKHFGKYALFVSFFPQIAAGPIGRIESLAPQFDALRKPDFERIKSGLLLIGQGLVKKAVIADRLAMLVNAVYDSPEKYNGVHFAVATLFFTFQIYCDFSGYSDMAVGSARILGYDLIINFRRPYLSTSIADFWKRWHISLTSWFRDNVYISLGGNRKRHLTNIMLVFLISGLWHGANLTFILWGFLNGLYQVAGIKLRPYTARVKAALRIKEDSPAWSLFRWLFNFALVCFAWIFFRANSVGDLLLILNKLFTFDSSFFDNMKIAGLGMDKADLFVAFLLIALLMVYEYIQEKVHLGAYLRQKPLAVRWAVYAAVFILIIVFGVYGDANGVQFIYFQF
jgi:alginate O-acetyltransferase complex protein AlgI